MIKTDFRLVLTNAIFKLLPTIAIGAYLWYLYSATLTELHTGVWPNVIVFSLGMTLAFFAYSYKLRFSVTFLILLAVLFGIYQYVESLSGGEFDTFYYSITFFIYAVIFLLSWLVGFGFARFSSFPWLVAIGIFVAAMSFVVGDYLNLQNRINSDLVMWASSGIFQEDAIIHRLATLLFMLVMPVLFYCIYIVTINELLRKMTFFDPVKFKQLMKRSVMTIAILLMLLFLPLLYAWLFGLPAALASQINAAEASSNSFLKKSYNEETQQPEFDLQDYAQLLPKVTLSDETVFCAYIDNFFETGNGGRIPIPVHFRRFVLNRYEAENEKFVLDPYPPSAIPGDLYSPEIRDVPIGFMVQDSVIEANAADYMARKNIASTVYVASLSPDAYVAPNTGYSYQKLPVPPEDKEMFSTVYQCSSQISVYNLPQYVYSRDNPQLESFKKERAEALRVDGIYVGLDSTFMEYYTEMDTTDTLLMNLSKELTEGKWNAYEKIEAISEFFTGKEADGTPRFTYNLEPGAPEKPGQSFMHYFLTENRQGYCTYFAGATTLLLRAAGIPCRVVVGYAIYDRSNKNDGWYWVYADQGHAWVEVYFPSYGWIDFDTTPGEDTEPVRPPRPDATPPDYAREPFVSTLGKITGMSADSTKLEIRPYSIRYKTQEYKIPEEDSQIITLKPKGGVVTIDGEKVKIGEFALDRNMVLSAYSFAYELEGIGDYRSSKPFMQWFVDKFPDVIPVDEAIVVYKEEAEDGKIFAVEGRIESIFADSSGISVIPDKITFRGKDYTIARQYAYPIKLKPEDGAIYIDGEKTDLNTFTLGDSMMIYAESAHPSLKDIKPFLATESFTSWFKHRFPKIIPVDRITLRITPVPVAQRIFWTLLIAVVAIALFLVLMATLVYFYYNWRFGMAKEPQKLYWLYRLSLMLLNQLGFHRVVKTPLEYARDTIDPKFETQLGKFVNIYHKAKYSPAGLAPEESRFVDDFKQQFNGKVFQAFSKGEVTRSFLNFIRTLRFLMAR